MAIAVIVPLLLTAVLSTHTDTVVCRYSGKTMPAQSCCPDEAGAPVSQATLRDQGCCTIRSVTRSNLISEHAFRWNGGGDHRGVVVSSAILPLPLPEDPAQRIHRLETAACRPPPLSLKQSLLI